MTLASALVVELRLSPAPSAKVWAAVITVMAWPAFKVCPSVAVSTPTTRRPWRGRALAQSWCERAPYNKHKETKSCAARWPDATTRCWLAALNCCLQR